MFRKRVIVSAFLLIALVLSAFGPAMAQDMMDAPPGFDSWDDVAAAADGMTVNWYMWGGSDSINNFVDETYGIPLAEEYNVTLNRVPLADTVDAVNQVLSEAEAGVEGDGGTIDLIWINGENFYTLKQAELLYGPWAENIPNSVYVNWDNPALNQDFGRPVEGFESPWGGAQFHYIYDSARMSADDLPRSHAELSDWIAMHPGRFTPISRRVQGHSRAPALSSKCSSSSAAAKASGSASSIRNSTTSTPRRFGTCSIAGKPTSGGAAKPIRPISANCTNSSPMARSTSPSRSAWPAPGQTSTRA